MYKPLGAFVTGAAAMCGSAAFAQDSPAPAALFSSTAADVQLRGSDRVELPFRRQYTGPDSVRMFEQQALELLNEGLELRGDLPLPRDGEDLFLTTAFLSGNQDCQGPGDCRDASVFFRSVSFGGSGGIYYHYLIFSDPESKNQIDVPSHHLAVEVASSENGRVFVFPYEGSGALAVTFEDATATSVFPVEFNYGVRGSYYRNPHLSHKPSP